MANINNTELLKGMRDNAKVQNLESVPTQLAEKVVPVMETNPRCLFCVNFSVDLISGAYTVPIGKKFYITNINLNLDTGGSLEIDYFVQITKASTELMPIVQGSHYQENVVPEDRGRTDAIIFPIPILMNENDKIEEIAGDAASVFVLGYLTDI